MIFAWQSFYRYYIVVVGIDRKPPKGSVTCMRRKAQGSGQRYHRLRSVGTLVALSQVVS